MRILLIILYTLLPLSFLQAQTIDTSELNKLQNGEYSIAEGQLQVLFSDTTTRAFALQEMHNMGVEVKSTDFNSILMIIENHPEKEHIRSIQKDESVFLVLNEASYVNSGEDLMSTERSIMEGNIDPESVSDFKFKDEYKAVMVHLKETATMKDANRIMDRHPDLKLRVLFEPRRSAVIQTDPDAEDNIITLLESKPYVKSVAFMGVLE
ncbi:hypothetical protein [Gracilimonas amylolytica]|uniref:hypothetical protein n=1 Tax=Gracilimonas amylolytica TaxID=1749045 RepID=UPI000CD9D746|nr:hypothetical protein [Gracilimonas amylolytica]